MSILLDGTGGVTTPGVVNTAGETIATTLSVTGATNLAVSSGNVGIGTASPSAKLNVVTSGGNSRISIGDTAVATYSTVLMYGGNGKYNFQLGAQANINNGFEITPSTAAGGTTFSTPAFIVDSSGNVGIGNTAPADRLQIEKANANCLLSVSRTTGGAGGRLVMQHTDSVGALQTTASVPLCFGTNDTERMRIDSSGNVTMPYQPAFNAYASGSLSGSQSPVVFNSVRLNRGSGYSTSTGRFTAPVAGAYFFSVTNNVLGASSNDGLIRKNGIAIIGVEYDVAQGGAWLGLTATTIIDLAIGDYVDFTMGGGTWSVEGTPWNNFVGHLIG